MTDTGSLPDVVLPQELCEKTESLIDAVGHPLAGRSAVVEAAGEEWFGGLLVPSVFS